LREEDDELLSLRSRLLLLFRNLRRSEGAVKNVCKIDRFAGNVREISRYEEDEEEDDKYSAAERILGDSSYSDRL